MKTVFIVRPFGIKRDAEGKKIDFDKVHTELIAPAIARLGLRGDTTAEIVRSGNIRTDMFELLAKADLVIADVSIHNANVFYELGIRQSLRDKSTFLIRCRADEIPFDLKTDRYLVYERKKPADSLHALITGLKQTLAFAVVDSPIFQLVPALQPQDATRLITLPKEFSEEVKLAADNRRLGDLELFATESREFSWASAGLRLVGQAQFKLKGWESARETWEALRNYLPDDSETNFKLGTIYQRLDDLAKSDICINRTIEDPDLPLEQRAEGYALLGSNEKTRWREGWQAANDSSKPQLAMGSRYLQTAQQHYFKGFSADLNHYYSGVNALALSVIVDELARQLPEVWRNNFDTPYEAECALTKLQHERERLQGAVSLSVDRHLRELERKGSADRWADITEADVKLLTGVSAERIAAVFRKAFEGAEAFYFESETRQLSLFRQLGILTEETDAALSVLEELSPEQQREKQESDKHIILFTGHRIDQPDRPIPRFPQKMEEHARQAIKQAIEKDIEGKDKDHIFGLAGGASGGDILFHEVCKELNIASQLFLAIDRDAYISKSVRVEGSPEWVERFRQIELSCKTRVLCPDGQLPDWMGKQDKSHIWVRNNLWTLYNALAYGGKHLTLIALWNGDIGDGPGGTEHMVSIAKERGAKIEILDTRQLFAHADQ